MNTPLGSRGLRDALTELAGSPDDISALDRMLTQIASLVAALVTPVDYASVTAQRQGTPTTVAISNQVALAVDEAQYADGTGPCVDALREGRAISVDIATTMSWPGFRDAARSLGLQASLSIPLFAGSGHPVAALNLYGRNADALQPLTRALIALFDQQNRAGESSERPATGSVDLDAGSTELLSGLRAAFAVQHHIHIAVGALMHVNGCTADTAYLILRDQAATTGQSLSQAASEVVATLTE